MWPLLPIELDNANSEFNAFIERNIIPKVMLDSILVLKEGIFDVTEEIPQIYFNTKAYFDTKDTICLFWRGYQSFALVTEEGIKISVYGYNDEFEPSDAFKAVFHLAGAIKRQQESAEEMYGIDFYTKAEE